MEKSFDKAAFNSVMRNPTVRQRIKKLQKNKAGRTNKEKNPKLHEESIKERKIHQHTVLQSVSCLVVLLDCKPKPHS